MSDLRPEDRLTSSKSDGLAELICAKVERWEQDRDGEYRHKWEEYARMWKGEWAPQDRDRTSERSKAIMPAIQQAVDSAVSEVEEALFGQERWFDVASDDPNTEPDESGPGRQIADQMMLDLEESKDAVSQAALLAAVYGTGIAKLNIAEAGDGISGGISVSLQPIEPLHFAIETGAETVDEAEGVAHCFTLPYNVVLERQRQGIYEKIDPMIGVDAAEEHDLGQTPVHIIEYQGLVPKKMLPDVFDTREKLSYEDDLPVEAIVTIANHQVVLRAVENPLKDRGIIAFPWEKCPGEFWGRGIVEKGYWPQKVLDAEVRSRIDALGLSTHPMMAINAAMVPRGADFSVRPGRNVFINGNPADGLQPMKFPSPDPQTYTQGQEMQRMIEMATGQMQAATPFAVNGRNETASGMSMMLGASIRRTRRTMANIERHFMKPFIRKAYQRFAEFDPRYPQLPMEFRVKGALGMMAREFEAMQLTQLLNAIPPGAPQFMLLRSVVDNMSISGKQSVLQLLDLLTAQALEPQQEPVDLGGEARMLSAQIRAQEVQANLQLEERRLALEERKVALQEAEAQANNNREIMRLSVDAERVESEDMGRTAKAINDLASAQQQAMDKGLADLMKKIEGIQTNQVVMPTQSGGVDLSEIHEALANIQANLPTGEIGGEDISPVSIERDADGLVTSVNGRNVQRDSNGLIVGMQ